MAARRIGLGLSGGGDSTALLLALREAAPEMAVHAYIVDHGLRRESTAEARLAAETAERAGASARILAWTAPGKGQGRARAARHRLLAEACRTDGVSLLCLAHTLDDRIETLRMRAARGAPERAMAGPGPLDPSPAWPEGRGLVIARPFLTLTRATLRAYLASRDAAWAEDPSNADPAYERARLRAAPISADAAASLLARSDAARAETERVKAAARALIEAGAALTGWGGARPDRARFAAAPDAVAERAFEALVLAVSGRRAPPAPALTRAGLAALQGGRAWTGAGAMLTAHGVLGRDPGAGGRADGVAAPCLGVKPGETGVFDGRFEVRGRAHVVMLGARRPDTCDLSAVPGAFRATLPYDVESGAVLASAAGRDRVAVRSLQSDRIAARVMALSAPAWFDGACAEARACAALAKPSSRPNITA